ncbi:MAG TPA: dynamin family protein [Gammaproteobacteria bacterium]
MMAVPNKSIRKRLTSLEQHLRNENPLLVQAVDGFRRLSAIGYATGLLGSDESYATQVSWWPLISVLGTFSAGKSTFINNFLGVPLQDTGNQAVDDKFTVICYSGERDTEGRVLPGLALDSDPRFPFYQTSEELEHVAPGEGRRIDAYLQLKTCRSERLKGRILIDSPGFDADAQRTATLRLTNHIIDLSDLVLVFFDARHPEPGAMSDTLAHLVRNTIDRADSSKFLYILNQIDTAAREDNPEEVVGAWQRALAREGLTAGRFYCIYSPDVTLQSSNESLRRRFEWKRDQDLEEILNRVEQVSVERVYRIMGTLQKRAQEIADRHIPQIRTLLTRWRSLVLQTDALLAVLLVAAIMGGAIWNPAKFATLAQRLTDLLGSVQGIGLFTAGIAVALTGVHFGVRHWAVRHLQKRLKKELSAEDAARMSRVLHRNARFWRSIFEVNPVGWSGRHQRRLQKIVDAANLHVQSLNDHYTDPTGKRHPPVVHGEVAFEPAIGEVLRGTR